MKRLLLIILLALATTFGLAPRSARAEKLSDIADVVGARDNQLVGYGIVTGLDGTGDDIRSQIAEQTLRSMLRRLGIQIDARNLRLRNVAAVIVTTTIPPFSKNGSKLDVTVSSVGNARSLAGGVLIQTPLRGADRHTYAVAQGPIVVGGFEARGRTGTSIQVNSTTTGRIPGGALVEREVETELVTAEKDGDKGAAAADAKPKAGDEKKAGEDTKADAAGDKPDGDGKKKEPSRLTYALRQPDFVTAQRAAQAINDALGEKRAEAFDGGSIVVELSDEFRKNPVPLVARLSEVEVTPHQPARVIINERTGTVVAGGDVRLAPAAVSQGGISVSIYEQFQVSQPNPFAYSGPQTVVVPQTDVNVQEKEQPLKYLNAAATLSDVATALSALGVTPRELSSVMQALKAAGSLRAEVIVQ